MNNVSLAKTAGFCFGVKRAVELVYKEIDKGNKIYTYGPIIHNDEVVSDLISKGVQVLSNRRQLESLKEGTVVIRSHGVSKEIYDQIQNQGLDIIDSTCPLDRKSVV